MSIDDIFIIMYPWVQHCWYGNFIETNQPCADWAAGTCAASHFEGVFASQMDSIWDSSISRIVCNPTNSCRVGAQSVTQHLKMITMRPSIARALACLQCQPVLCTQASIIVIRYLLASGIVDPIGSLIGIWIEILWYVLPANACLLESVTFINFEMLACKVYEKEGLIWPVNFSHMITANPNVIGLITNTPGTKPHGSGRPIIAMNSAAKRTSFDRSKAWKISG